MWIGSRVLLALLLLIGAANATAINTNGITGGNGGGISVPSIALPPTRLSAEGTAAETDLNCQTNLGFNLGQSGTIASLVNVVRSASNAATIVDSKGNWSVVPDNTLRRSDLGCWVEPTRENYIRNNTAQGAVNGPLPTGALPTNWGWYSGGALTMTIVGRGTQNGVDYVDINLSGTPTATSFDNIAFEPVNQIVASPSQVWSDSSFLAIVGGSLNNIVSISSNVAEYTGTSYVGELFTNIVQLPSSIYRFGATGTVAAGVNNLQPYLQIRYNSGAAINITIRIGWPQLELGGNVTSPIRTTGTAITRNVDQPTLVNVPPNFANMILVGYVQLNSAPIPDSSSGALGGWAAATGYNDMAWSGMSTNNWVAVNVNNGGVSTAIGGGPLAAVGQTFKMAGNASTGSQYFALDGRFIGGTGGGSVTTQPIIRVAVGTDPWSQSIATNGFIQRFALIPIKPCCAETLTNLTRTPGVLVADITPGDVGSGVQANIDLNFATNQGFNGGTGTAASMITDQRVTTTNRAYAQDSNGVWFSFPNYVPRITDLGLVTEQASTSLVPWSGDYSQGWSPGAGTAGPDTTIPPLFPGTVVWHGTYTGAGDNNVGANGGALITIALNTTYTESAWIYLPTTNSASSSFAITFEGSTAMWMAPPAVSTKGKWTYFTYTNTSNPSGTLQGALVFRLNGVAGDQIYVTGLNFEQSPLPTSFIPTYSATGGQRTADGITVNGMFASRFATAGTMLWKGSVPGGENFGRVLNFDQTANSGQNTTGIGWSNGSLGFGVTNAATDYSICQQTMPLNTVQAWAGTYATNDGGCAFDGTLQGAPPSTVVIPPLDRMGIGIPTRYQGDYIQQTVKRVAGWTTYRVTNPGLQTLTTLP